MQQFDLHKKGRPIFGIPINIKTCSSINWPTQGLVKEEKFCFRNLDFYFWHGEGTSTASQKSKDLNEVPLAGEMSWLAVEVLTPCQK